MTHLIAPLLVSLCCGQGDWQPEEFPIGFWNGPPPSANKVETWKAIARANFTFVGPCLHNSLDDNKRMLDFCQLVGLRAMVVDRRLRPQMVGNNGWRDTVRKVVDDYGSHPALYAYYLSDEPNAGMFGSLGQLHAELQKHDPRHPPYINLLPQFASPEQLGTPTYEEHLQRFMAVVRPQILSYDHYCLRKGSDGPTFFANLAIIREHAIKNGVPPWNIILTTPHMGFRDPTDAEMRWQVYTSLAYGMKGILYFTYWPFQESSAIVDSAGVPTRRYDIVQKLNGEMRAIGKLLLSLDSTGVFHTGAIPQGCSPLPADFAVQLPNDLPLLMGCFQDTKGDRYVMIVNRDYDGRQQVPVSLATGITSVTEISTRTGNESPQPLRQGAFRTLLAAGAGRLFRLHGQFEFPRPFRDTSEIAFEFENGDEGWVAAYQLSPAKVEQGLLRSTVKGNHPYFTHTNVDIEPDRYKTIVVRMKLPKGNSGQVYWQTEEERVFHASRHADFLSLGDDQFHEYEIEVGDHPQWKGHRIRALRFDPEWADGAIGQTVEIDYIRGR